jgi:exodeoxyribonuclease VII large subunit
MATSARAISPPASPASAGSSEPSLAQRRIWSVHKVVERAGQVLREKAPPLWVRGEISGWKRYASGHCFFTLKDAQAELCCVLWADAARRLPTSPDNGLEVDVFGQLGIYPRRGQFRLEVSRLESTGIGGMWGLARERLIEQLRREGLLEESRKRALPEYPERVGIATSSTSAALQDMFKALRRKAWWTHTLVSDCRVEGVVAAPEIAAAIRRFGTCRESCRVDVVIVARGGGSTESLWAFNTEVVARAIAACPVPVISAVGHETDYTVADLVADVRAPTPTAGAERAVPDGRQVLSVLTEFPHEASLRMGRRTDRWQSDLLRRRQEMARALSRRLGALALRIEAAARHIEGRSPRQTLRRAEEELRRTTDDLHAAIERRLRSVEVQSERETRGMEEAITRRLLRLERELAAQAEALDARSPLRVLARGYAVVSDPATGQVVRSAEEVRPEQRLRVRLREGEIPVRVEAEGVPDLPPSP